ncbi:MAG: 4-hydroxyphenylpyruvate dioxygenase [Bacteriovoracaceae bacterium]|nr:4-hydroxyphenylpyruvate dioxygenase [Bacteriovoracaceae bacterium]
MENNPIGIKAIDHLEFTCDSLTTNTAKDFSRLGFARTEVNPEQATELFTQGQIRFLLNANKKADSASRKYFNQHGEGVSKISFLVDNAEKAIETAVKRGAVARADLKVTEDEAGVYKTAAIQGFGDVLNEFVERPMTKFRSGYKKLEQDKDANPLKVRVARIDHLTNNVPKGEMPHWVDFYKRIYGFVETRYFDIKGIKTGLQSKVVQLASGAVIIPINEPEAHNGKSQIQEFLDRHKGPGVQHIALTTPDIITTVAELREREIQFLNVPDTYYEDIPKRKLNVTEDLNILRKNQILVDGDHEGYLLQIFSDTYVGPLFYEFIQRKNHMGFGEGNFQALFDAIERDQIKRGYLK